MLGSPSPCSVHGEGYVGKYVNYKPSEGVYKQEWHGGSCTNCEKIITN